MAREVTLGWMADDKLGATLYVVQFREVNVTDFNTSSPVSICMYTFMCIPSKLSLKHESSISSITLDRFSSFPPPPPPSPSFIPPSLPPSLPASTRSLAPVTLLTTSLPTLTMRVRSVVAMAPSLTQITVAAASSVSQL